MRFELSCKFCSQQSFYGKAIVELTEDNITKNYKLYSYGTLVAIYTENKLTNLKQYTCLDRFSTTTSRHQKEFFKQFGLTDDEVKQVFENNYIEKKEV